MSRLPGLGFVLVIGNRGTVPRARTYHGTTVGVIKKLLIPYAMGYYKLTGSKREGQKQTRFCVSRKARDNKLRTKRGSLGLYECAWVRHKKALPIGSLYILSLYIFYYGN